MKNITTIIGLTGFALVFIAVFAGIWMDCGPRFAIKVMIFSTVFIALGLWIMNET